MQAINSLNVYLQRVSESGHKSPLQQQQRPIAPKGGHLYNYCFTSTPVTTLETKNFYRNPSYHRDSASPELKQTRIILPSDVTGRLPLSPLTLCDLTTRSPDSSMFSSRSSSPMSLPSLSEESVSVSSGESASVSSASSGSDVAVDLIVADEPVWRPW